MNALCSLQLDTTRENAVTPSIHFLSIYWALLLSHFVISFKKTKPAIFFLCRGSFFQPFWCSSFADSRSSPSVKRKSGYDSVVTENTSTSRHFFLAASEKSTTSLADSLEIQLFLFPKVKQTYLHLSKPPTLFHPFRWETKNQLMDNKLNALIGLSAKKEKIQLIYYHKKY